MMQSMKMGVAVAGHAVRDHDRPERTGVEYNMAWQKELSKELPQQRGGMPR